MCEEKKNKQIEKRKEQEEEEEEEEEERDDEERYFWNVGKKSSRLEIPSADRNEDCEKEEKKKKKKKKREELLITRFNIDYCVKRGVQRWQTDGDRGTALLREAVPHFWRTNWVAGR